jgi:streptogramin lyase
MELPPQRSAAPTVVAWWAARRWGSPCVALLVALAGWTVLAPVSRAADFAHPVFTELPGGLTAGLTANGAPAAAGLGPDGNVWFGETAGPGRIAKVTPTGAVTELTGGITPGLSAGRGPANVVAGPDGNLWVAEFADPGGIARVTPSGTVTEFPGGASANAHPTGITVGPDGDLWFAEFANPGRITKISTAGTVTEIAIGGATAGFSANGQPRGIALGPDGNIWFTEYAPPGRIARYTPSGVMTEFTGGVTPGLPADSRPVAITSGPDGNLWFTDQGGGGRIGRITPAGVVTEFSTFLPDRGPALITSGPDGALWFTEQASPGGIGRITTDGTITEFLAGGTPGFTADRAPVGIAVGADGNVWFTESGGPGAVVRISPGVAAPAPPAPPSPPAADTSAPETTITAGPVDGASAGASATYAFRSDDPAASFQCRVYDASGNPALVTTHFTPCSSPLHVPDPSRPQIQAFEVRAVDAAGNVDPTPAVRHVIKHGAAGAPEQPSRCRMISVRRAHANGARLLPGCRLAQIRRGKVACLQIDTLKKGTCPFDKRRSRWLESRSGPDYAMVGQSLRTGTKAKSRWIVAASTASGHTVPCQKPTTKAKAADTAGRVSSGSELATTCIVEESLQKWNALSAYGWTPLVNWANFEVCASNRPSDALHPSSVLHPDGVAPTRLLPDGTGACYTGAGAALNDINGTERDRSGKYLDGPAYCHYIIVGGLEVPGAKRPATRYPKTKTADGKTHYDLTRREINPATPIVWRAVDPNLNLANGPVADEPEPQPAPAPVEAP